MYTLEKHRLVNFESKFSKFSIDKFANGKFSLNSNQEQSRENERIELECFDLVELKDSQFGIPYGRQSRSTESHATIKKAYSN